MSKIKIANNVAIPMNITLVPKGTESKIEYVGGLKPASVVEDQNGTSFTLAPRIDWNSRVRLGAIGVEQFVNPDYVTNPEDYTLEITDSLIKLSMNSVITPDNPNYNEKAIGLFLKLTEDEYQYVLQNRTNDSYIAILENGVTVSQFSIASVVEGRQYYFEDDYIDVPLIPTGLTLSKLEAKDYQYTLALPDFMISPVTVELKPTVVEAVKGVNLSTTFDDVAMVGAEIPLVVTIKPETADLEYSTLTSSDESILKVEGNIATVVGVGTASINLEVKDLLGNVFTDRLEYTTYLNSDPLSFKVDPSVSNDINIRLKGESLSVYSYTGGYTSPTLEGDDLTVTLTGTTEPVRLYVTGEIDSIDFSNTVGLLSIDSWGGVNPKALGIAGLVHLTTLPNVLPTALESVVGLLKGCSAFNSAVNNWDISGYESIDYLFEDCISFDKPVNLLNTSKVTSMVGTFKGCTAFNKPLASLSFDKVLDLSSFLEGAISFNQSLETINVNTVKNFSRMFYGTQFNQDISSWNVSNATNMDEMFHNAVGFSYNLNFWCVTNITTRPKDFGLAEAVSPIWGTCPVASDSTSIEGVPDVVEFNDRYQLELVTNYPVLTEEWDIKPVGSAVLSDDKVLTILSDEGTVTVSVTVNTIRQASVVATVSPQRNGISIVTNTGNSRSIRIVASNALDLNWGDGTKVSGVLGEIEHTYEDTVEHTLTVLPTDTDLGEITIEGGIVEVLSWGDYPIDGIRFGTKSAKYATDLTKVKFPLPSTITSYNGLFRNCYRYNQALDGLSFKGITNIDEMLAGCIEFNQPVDHLDVSNLESMNGVFAGCTFFNQPLVDWDVSNIRQANRFLADCNSYDQDLSNWCVPYLESEPEDFATGTKLTEEMKPVWGTCPIIPPIDVSNAKPISGIIETEDSFIMNQEGHIVNLEPMTIEELYDKAEPDAVVHTLEDIDTSNSKSSTEEIDLYGRWFVMVNDELVSLDNLSLDEIKVELAKLGIEMVY